MMEDIGLVLLAAGRSLRMGEPKLLLPLEGIPLLEHTLQSAGRYPWGKRIAVIGEPRFVLEQLCRKYGFETVFNPAPEKGQSYSLKLGLMDMPEDLRGFLFLPGDQPFISGKLLEALVKKFDSRKGERTIVVPYCGGQNRSPALFGAGWLAALRQIEGDRGGRQLIKENPSLVEKVCWQEPREFLDVDTREDYELLKRGL